MASGGRFQPNCCPTLQPLRAEAWLYPNFALLKQYFQLRNSLVPYLYSAAFAASKTAVLPMHALYIDYPDSEEEYEISRWSSNISTVAPCPHVPQYETVYDDSQLGVCFRYAPPCTFCCPIASLTASVRGGR